MLDKDSAILLVEDDRVDVMTVQRALRKSDFRNPLYVARTALDALAMLRGEGGETIDPPPALILPPYSTTGDRSPIRPRVIRDQYTRLGMRSADWPGRPASQFGDSAQSPVSSSEFEDVTHTVPRTSCARAESPAMVEQEPCHVGRCGQKRPNARRPPRWSCSLIAWYSARKVMAELRTKLATTPRA